MQHDRDCDRLHSARPCNCGLTRSPTPQTYCVVDPSGKHLPEPTADNERDLIEAFEALSETPWQAFVDQGYSVGTMPIVN